MRLPESEPKLLSCSPYGAPYYDGPNSSIIFSGGFTKTIIAYGGGVGGAINNAGKGGTYVGSSGGVGQAFNTTPSDTRGLTPISVVTVSDPDYFSYAVKTGGPNAGYDQNPGEGGGGGGGGAGNEGNKATSFGGNGGNGVQTSSLLLGIANFTFNSKNYGNLYWGGGGGGGSPQGYGSGGGGSGVGGGGGMFDPGTPGNGNNSINAANSINGGINTGGGGSGMSNDQPAGFAGSGGAGIVVIRYPDTFATATTTGSPNVIYANANIIYRFWQSGSITFP